MLKVTITFPTGVSVTLETTDPNKFGEVIAATREYLSAEDVSIPSTGLRSNGAAPAEAHANGNGALASSPEFLEFCQDQAPVGDMRRVVVAAEGAQRFLGMDMVSAEELGPLFDLVEWPRPRNFLQTLRNAGRSNFQWLQRAPAASGYYSVTDQGRNEIISPNGAGP